MIFYNRLPVIGNPTDLNVKSEVFSQRIPIITNSTESQIFKFSPIRLNLKWYLITEKPPSLYQNVLISIGITHIKNLSFLKMKSIDSNEKDKDISDS